MYMETKAHMNYWSTENFCGRWTLRTGTLFIASISTVLSLLSVPWCAAVLMCITGEMPKLCWFRPGPEAEAIYKMAPEGQSMDAERIIVICVAIYHTFYFIFSVMVFIGVFKKLPTLLSPWVGLTQVHMVLVLANLLVTLAFTTLLHLLLQLAHFVLSLCAWVVVKSHMQQLRVLRTKPPVPDNALLDYTVDGVDKIALDPVPR